MSEAVDGAGSVTAQQLSLPYGGLRYSNGTMPTSKGFTGQRADAATGLDYYGARYYDPVLGQFTSADDVLPGDGLDPWGLSRYAYVEGNPIARNDQDGHCIPWCVGALIGAVVGAGIAYGVQVYANYQSGKRDWDMFTSNIDPGLIAMGALDGAFIGGSLGIGVAVAGAAIGEGATLGTAAYLGGSAAATDYFYGTYRAGQIEQGDENELSPLEAGYARQRIGDARGLAKSTRYPPEGVNATDGPQANAGAYLEVDGVQVGKGTSWRSRNDPMFGEYHCAEPSCMINARGNYPRGSNRSMYVWQYKGKPPCNLCMLDIQQDIAGNGGAMSVYYQNRGGDLMWQRYYQGGFEPHIRPGWSYF